MSKFMYKVVRDDQTLNSLCIWLKKQAFPYTVSFAPGEVRTSRQNKLLRKWCKEIGAQTGADPESVRGYAKLHHGVPILIRDNKAFEAEWNEHIRPLPYEFQARLMKVPFDMAVTRNMNREQEAEMLDSFYNEMSERGYKMTLPKAKSQ